MCVIENTFDTIIICSILLQELYVLEEKYSTRKVVNKKMQRQRKCQLKKPNKEDLSKQLMKVKCKAKFNWQLAGTYWDHWRHEVEHHKF